MVHRIDPIMTQEPTHAENVRMIKSLELFRITASLIGFSLAFCILADESLANSQTEKTLSETSWTNENGELVISTGPKKNYTSTHITKSENAFFCKSNTVNLTVERRLDEGPGEPFKSFDIFVKYNGEEVDLFSGKGLPESIKSYFHIGVDMTCSDEEIGIFLTGYNDSTTENGATLVAAKIETKTGIIK